MKKLLSLVLALAMVLGMVSFASAEEWKVAMITDSGDITDMSFNQTTYEACKAFCEANGIEFKYYKPAGDSTPDRVAMVDNAVEEGFNVIVMPGYLFGATIVEVSEEYSDINFIALDVGAGDLLEAGVALKGESYDYNPDNWNLTDYVYMDNVFAAVYQEELSGYMAGYAAVKLGYKHLGFLGGMAVPAVIRFGYGYVQGVNAAAAEMGIADQVTVEYVYGNQFYGDADITAYMDNWYQNLGVEVVFACGGGIYSSAAEAAAKVGGKVIGVDTDQSPVINRDYGEGITVTSAMKGLAATVNTMLAEVVAGNFDNYRGQIKTMGLVDADPAKNYVQIPAETTQWTDAYTYENYVELVGKMLSGEVVVDNGIGAMPETVVTVNEYGNIK